MQESALYNFSIKQLRNLVQASYTFDDSKNAKPFPSYDLNGAVSLEQAVELATTGEVIAFPIKFLSGTYKRYDKTGKLIETTMPDFRLPAIVLGGFSRQKLMQVTDLGSGRGSVKEVDGHSDWSIEIAGIIVPEENHPQGITSFKSMLQHLAEWDSLMSSIEVSSELLTALGIYRVVIKSISIAQQEGIEDNADFSMSLLSDEEFELEIIE